MELKSITEIENMLAWLDGEISRHEIGLSKPYVSGRFMTINVEAETNRLHYAGCLAERAFYLDFKNRALCRERKLDDSGS